MSPAAIKARGEREALLHSTAEQIRTLRDGVREKFPGEEDEAEERVLELVTGDDES